VRWRVFHGRLVLELVLHTYRFSFGVPFSATNDRTVLESVPSITRFIFDLVLYLHVTHVRGVCTSKKIFLFVHIRYSPFAPT
jgi:hypothetical protein